MSFALRQQIRDRVKGIRILLSRGDAAHTLGNMSFAGDGLISRHDISFMNDERFQEAHSAAFAGVERQPYFQHLAWRIHIVTWAARLASESVPGDFIEFGVHHGFFSRATCQSLDFDRTGRRFFLVDSWGVMEGSHPRYTEDIFQSVKDRFRPFKSVKLVRGTVPAILDEIPGCESIAYLSLDMNDGVADHAALSWAWERMPVGGVIYIDDWGWQYPELRRLVGGFLKRRGCDPLVFPTGNALTIKT